MSLPAGTHLGSFEILRPLGAGGMGEVYLARDRDLNRTVAIKVLPPDVTTDPHRVARFEQEARAASALNHPNVCVIHALGRTDDGRRFIAMEHVEGQTLRARLTRGRLTRREMLDIAVQIASALSAAHAAGVVHRDLKPENVMLRPDGYVKVLDFGLAKLVQPSSGAALATRTVVHTDAGSAVGTVAYMSPEQARAQEVDARTDVWALGVVLYEMSAGQPPFVGASVNDVLAGILELEPDPLTRFNRDVPHELQRIVGKALRKNAEQRYQVMKDLQLDLEALRDEMAVSSTPRAPSVVQPGAKDGRRRWIAAGLLAMVLIALVTAGTWWTRRRTPVIPAASVPVDRPLTRVTFDPGLQIDAAFSPDGRSIAYSSDRAGNFDIWVQPLDGGGGQARQITTSPASDRQPSWSPDGGSIVFRSERDGGGLFVTPVHGGAERQLATFGIHPRWLANGTEILFIAGFDEWPTNVYVVSPDGDPPRELVKDFLQSGSWSWIAPHPDGRISTVGVHPKLRFGFYTVTRDGRHVTTSRIPEDFPLEFTETGARLLRFQWNAAGDALFVEALLNEVRNVWKIRLDPRTLAWLSAERLTIGTGPDRAAALSADGTSVAYTSVQQSARLWSFPFNAAEGRITGRGSPITAIGTGVENCRMSPDGRFVAYTLRAPGGRRWEMLLTDIDSGETEIFGVNALAGAWSFDSRTLAYNPSRPELPPPGEWALALRTIGGPERIIGRWSTKEVLLPTGWTPDGRFLLGSYLSPLYTGHAQLALWPATSASPPDSRRIIVSDPDHHLWQASFSPDGRWLVFLAQPKIGRSTSRVIVAPAAGGAEPVWTHVVGGDHWVDKPRWAPDGRAVYFISNRGSSFYNLWGIRFDPVRGKPLGEPFVITTFDSPGFILSPDVVGTEIGIAQRRAVLTMATVTGSIWMLENVGVGSE